MTKVALVGAGTMGTMHAGRYSEIDGAELVAVMDIRAEAGEALAAAHAAKSFTNFEEMLRSVRPDIVDVCCPTPWHRDYVVTAANLSKELGIRGISTEKPMARTHGDCLEMSAACRSAGVPLFVAHVVRFFPEFVTARRMVQSGSVGVPASVRTRRGGPMPSAWRQWYSDFDLSGGCVLDLIIHDFDWLRWTFGEVERVYACGLGASRLPNQDYALVTIRFQSGVIGHVEGTWADPGGFKVTIEIAGDDGLLEYNCNQPTGAPFRMALRDATGSSGGVAVPESPTGANPYTLELAHFLDSVERGVPASIQPEDGAAAVAIALAALESIATGRAVSPAETPKA
ncbi:MAG: Gfo/Idh/MocA family oxidoreductase [Armatimonadetes bacterium]|nr:Gfo/Idh/MocA family oxidoreductase [Armatimonadota bacterium]MDE2205577.1 Gfo/Idh/MocA family oxidoreductase [Armatimonadota bacterium]